MMTKQKQTNRLLIPVVILVVLAVVAILATDPFGWNKPPADVPDEDAPEIVPLCLAEAGQVTAFEIIKPGEAAFRLEREGEEWLVKRGEETFRANMERVDKLVADVPGLMSGSLATDKADKHATFEVDDNQAIGLNVYVGGDVPTAELLVGKSTDTFSGAYIRNKGDDRVYRAAKNIKSLVGFSFQDFCTKTPWDFDPTLAETVTIAPPGGEGETLAFTRNNGIWQLPDGANGNQNKLNELLDKLSKLRISGFADDADPEVTGLAGAAPAINVTAGGREYQLVVGAKEESQYYIADQDGHPYKASEYNLKLYTELAFDELTFDDVPAATPDDAHQELSGEMEPDEGVENGLPSDIDE